MMSNTGSAAINRILYVDDEPALLDIGKVFLEEDGSFAVDTSHSAPDALVRLSSCKYDAIVSDYQMPKMDGIAFLKALRVRGDTTPFIIFTGRGREDVVIEALNSGADFYLQKGGDPVSQFAELAHKILHAISQKRADLALKKSELEYRHLIEHAGEGIFVIQDERFRMINPRAAELSGYSEQELLNQPFVRFVHPDEGDMLLDKFRNRNFGSTVPTHYTFRTICKDTTVRWVELNVVAITWDERPATLNFMTDITDRKLTEDALKESEERYRHLIEHAGEGIYVVQDGKLQMVNSRTTEMCGYTEQELISQPFKNFVHPDDFDILIDRFWRRIRGETVPSRYSFRIARKDGTLRWVELSVGIIDWNGAPATLNYVTDITDRKLAEDALRESEERYRQFFRTTLDGLFITTPAGQWIDFNDAVVEMFGFYNRDEIFSSPIISFYVNPEDRVAFVERVEREGYVKENPVSFRKRDGTIFDSVMTVVVQRNPDGSTKAFIGTIRDITGRKRIEEALRESAEQYRLFFKTSQDSVFITGSNGRYIDFNDNLFQRLGCKSREEAMAVDTISTYAHPEERKTFIDLVNREGYLKEYPITFRRRDGREFDTLISIVAQKNSNGSIKAYFGTIRDITERKRAEAALRESEDRYRVVTQMITDFVWDWNTSTGCVQWFGDIDTALGYAQGEFPRTFEAWERSVHPDDHDRVMNAIRRSLETGERFDGEYRMLARNGTCRHFHDRGTTIADAEGARVRMIGAVTDITERKRTEDALRESEERYRLIFESFEDLYYQTDTNGIITILSPSLNRLTGWTEKELIGTSITKIYVNPEDRQVLLNELAEKGYVRDYEVRLRMRDGRETPVSLSANRIFHPDGSPAGVAGIIRDITRRKRAEDALKESEVKFRSLVDHALEAIMITDMQGNVLFCNNAAARTVDAENCEDLTGRNVMEVIAPESRADVAKDFEEVARGHDAYVARYHLVTLKGRDVFVESIGKVIAYEGRPADLISLRDVTGQKQ